MRIHKFTGRSIVECHKAQNIGQKTVMEIGILFGISEVGVRRLHRLWTNDVKIVKIRTTCLVLLCQTQNSPNDPFSGAIMKGGDAS